MSEGRFGFSLGGSRRKVIAIGAAVVLARLRGATGSVDAKEILDFGREMVRIIVGVFVLG